MSKFQLPEASLIPVEVASMPNRWLNSSNPSGSSTSIVVVISIR